MKPQLKTSLMCSVALLVACWLAPSSLRASDYEDDVKKAIENLRTYAGDNGMTRDDRMKYEAALLKYGDERGRLMEDMVRSLSVSDPSNIRTDWTDRCRKAKDMLNNLDSVGPQKMKEIGLGGFADGEKKIWEANEKGDIPYSIQLMVKLQLIDAVLMKQFAEDISKVRDGDKIIEKMLEDSDNGASGFLKGAIQLAAENTVKPKVKGWFDHTPWKPYTDWVIDKLPGFIAEHDKAVKEKRLLKQILLHDIEYVEKARDQLSVDWIKKVADDGEKFAEGLQGIGKGDGYEARDWDRFKSNIKDKLRSIRDKSVEGSEKVFRELLPAFKEEIKNKYMFVTDDPAVLERRRKEVDDEFKTMEDLFVKQKQLIDDLDEGRFKQTLKAAWEDAHNKVVISYKLLVDKEKEEDAEIKKD